MALDSAAVGTPSFLRSLIRDASADSFPLEPIIFQSILLCLVSGDKHLILRTADGDVGLVARLASLILSTLFQLPVQKLRIRPRTSAETELEFDTAVPFLQSLFLPTHALASDENLSKRPGLSVKRRSRSRSFAVRSQSIRSVSFSNDLNYIAPPSADGGKSLHPCTSGEPGSPPLTHAHSDPTPIRARAPELLYDLPSGLVLSGPENASFSSQKALSQVLLERKVSLWDEDEEGIVNEAQSLPPDFIVVYVCKMDGTERPEIHKTLLDKFAMSATVSVTPSVRLLASSVLSPPLLSPQAVGPFPSSGHTPSSTPPSHNHRLPTQSWQPSLALQARLKALLHVLRKEYEITRLNSTLLLYMADIFCGARHHPQLDGSLLTAKSIRDAEDLTRASRVLGNDPTGMALIRQWASVLASSKDSEVTRDGTDYGTNSDQGSALSMLDVLDDIASGTETVAVADPMRKTAPVSTPGLVTAQPIQRPAGLDVTQADVARIVPRVMSHRLRIRKGPQEEVLSSAVFGSSFMASSNPQNGPTVKDVIVRILSDV